MSFKSGCVAALSTVPNQTVCLWQFSYDTAVRFDKRSSLSIIFSDLIFLSLIISRSSSRISIRKDSSGTSIRPNLCKRFYYIIMNLFEMFKDKLENLVVTEASADPGPGEVESGHGEELAEEEETLIGGTGVEETVDEEIEELVVTEAKLDGKEDSVVDFKLQLSRSIHLSKKDVRDFSQPRCPDI